MSVSVEKRIIDKIKELLGGDKTDYQLSIAVHEVKELVDSYVDPGYIGGPIVGEPEKEETVK